MQYDTLMNVEEQFKFDFEKSERILSLKEQQLNDLVYEVEIMKKNSAELVSRYIDALQFLDFHALWIDFDNKTCKFKEHPAENKARLSLIEQWFFDKDTKRKLLRIVCGGYSGDWYSFEYKVGSKVFAIRIPIFKQANMDNYKNFYYCISNKDSEHCYSVISGTRFLKEVAGMIKEYLGT